MSVLVARRHRIETPGRLHRRSRLPIPIGGICAGHPCDTCPRCLRGYCCRSDNPNYTLPSLGDWFPIFGQLGVRNTDGTKVECHACGGWFQTVGYHANAVHDLPIREYRAVFGLNTKGIVGAHLHEVLSVAGRLGANKNLKLSGSTAEQRAIPRTLETRLADRSRMLTANAPCVSCGGIIQSSVRRPGPWHAEDPTRCYECQRKDTERKARKGHHPSRSRTGRPRTEGLLLSVCTSCGGNIWNPARRPEATWHGEDPNRCNRCQRNEIARRVRRDPERRAHEYALKRQARESRRVFTS
jgi:hypothetical protein